MKIWAFNCGKAFVSIWFVLLGLADLGASTVPGCGPNSPFLAALQDKYAAAKQHLLGELGPRLHENPQAFWFLSETEFLALTEAIQKGLRGTHSVATVAMSLLVDLREALQRALEEEPLTPEISETWKSRKGTLDQIYWELRGERTLSEVTSQPESVSPENPRIGSFSTQNPYLMSAQTLRDLTP